MLILKRVSSIKHIGLQALVPALLVMVVSFGPWISVHPQEMSSGTPTVIAPTSAPVEPAPAAAATEIPSHVETAPVPQAPVEPAPPVEEAVPPTDVPVAPVEPAPVAPAPLPVEPTPVEPAPIESPTNDAVEVPAPAPIDIPVLGDDVAVPDEQDVDTGETEEDPAETSGNDPGGDTPTEATITETVVPELNGDTGTETAVATEAEIASATETPTTTLAAATPAPTKTPEPTPTPTPTTINWNLSGPVSCEQNIGDPQSLALGDTATWRCQVSIAADITGEAPKDLHVLWQIDVDYAGDDVRLSLPSGTVASILVPDSSPGGTSELATYRTDWADGQSLTFDVTVTRTTCLVGKAQLTIGADTDVKTANNDVQITRSGESPLDAHLVSVASSNQDALVVSMQPVEFGKLEWDGKTWGTAYAASTVTVSNANPCATSQAYLVQVEVVTSNPGMTPVIASVNVPRDYLVPVAIADQNTDVVGIASVPVGFEGTAEVEILLVLSPALEVDPGSHTFGFQVAVVPAP